MRNRRARNIVVAGVALTVVARLFDTVPLYVPGVAFLAIGLLVPVWSRLATRGATVRRTLKVRHVPEDEAFQFELEVRCGPMPALVGVVLDPLVADPIPIDPRARSGTHRVTARLARRGLRRLEAPVLMIRDPFDVSRRVCRAGGPPQELLVLPRIEPIRFGEPGSGGPSPGVARLQRSATREASSVAEVEIDGLRPYREGTSASRIHWAAMARGAGLLERRLRAEGDGRPLVVLDARGAERDDDLDAAVRAAASITFALSAHGGCALLLPGERRATLLDGGGGAWAAAHARLALVESSPGMPAPFLAGVGVRRGPTFYVAARRLQRLPAAADGVARSARVLVVPGTLGGRAASFHVAGCTGYELAARVGARRVPRPRAQSGEAA